MKFVPLSIEANNELRMDLIVMSWIWASGQAVNDTSVGRFGTESCWWVAGQRFA